MILPALYSILSKKCFRFADLLLFVQRIVVYHAVDQNQAKGILINTFYT